MTTVESNDDTEVSSFIREVTASHARENGFLKVGCKREPYSTTAYEYIYSMVLLCVGFTNFQQILKICILKR